MVTAHFGSILMPIELERLLKRNEIYVRSPGGWKFSQSQPELDLDLSGVEYADFAALAQVALLVEGAARHGCPVRIAAPLCELSIAEQNYLSSLAKRSIRARNEETRLKTSVARRRQAFKFMSRCGFFSVVQPSHVPYVDELVTLGLEWREDWDWAEPLKMHVRAAGIGDVSQYDADSPADLRDIVPLQWLSQPPGGDAARWETDTARLLALKAPSLTTSDVDAVVTVVLRELVDNVRSHSAEAPPSASCPPAPLIGVIADGPGDPHPARIGDRDLVREYGLWLRDRGAPVVRLVVGDSGRGICETLKPPAPGAPEADLPNLGRQLRRSERALLWSLSPWSSGGDQAGTRKPRVRGLASVRRVVREAAGAIILRSADAAAGMIYPDGTRIPVSRSRLAQVPGTLVEIVLAPAAISPARVSASSDRGRRGSAVVVVDPGTTSEGAPDKRHILSRLRESSSTCPRDSVPFLCVVSDIPAGQSATEAFLSGLLQIAEEVADRELVVLLALGQSLTEIAPRIRSFDDVRAQSGEVAGVPVMVVDQRGHAAWLGVDRRQSAILAALARGSAGTVSVETLGRQVAASGAAVSDCLRRMPNWIGRGEENAWLRFSPSAMDEALHEWALNRARGYLGQDHGAPGRGPVYVTPTLALVGRRIEDSALFRAIEDRRLTGYILGRRVAEALKENAGPEVSVACIGDFPSAATDSFRAAAGAFGPVIVFSGEAGLYDDPEIPFIAAGSKFVLLTSNLVTAERARHAANDLVRAGAEPLCVAAILDGRNGDGPLSVLGLSVRVIPLMRAGLIVEGDYEDALPADPVQVPNGSGNVDYELQYPIPRDTILSWCESTQDAMLTGHIARHSRRHFHSFLDPAPILAQEGAREVIADVAVRTIARRLHEIPAGEISGVAFIHAGEPNSVAGRLARLVADALSESAGSFRIGGVFPLRQALVGGRWVMLPPREGLAPGTAVLVIDWGSITLHTIQGLMTAAAQAGAAMVLALVLTSQLDRAEEVTARSIRAVAGRPDGSTRVSSADGGLRKAQLEVGPGAPGDPIPARIEFLSSFPVGYSAAWECLPCKYSREYADEARRESSELLESHARRLAQSLAPKDLAASRKDGPLDAMGLSLTAVQAVRLMHLRGRLESARLSTRGRVGLRSYLLGISEADLDALVRLLTLESRLLKRPPMRHKGLRDILHAKLLDRLDNAKPSGMDIALRRQYILLIRAIAKKDYLSHFRDWLIDYVRSPETLPIALDLLLGMQSLVSRPYHQSLKDAEVAERALSGALDDIRNDPILMRERDALSIVATLSQMLAHTRYNSLTAAASPSPQEAWASLRRNYYTPVMEHTVDARMSSVLAAVQLNRARENEMWQSTLRDWQATQDFLVRRVLPLLPPIRNIVLARLYNRPSDEDIERWRVACGPEVLQELQKVNSLLVRFVEDPQYAMARKDEARRLVSWWHRFFFAKSSLAQTPGVDGLLTVLSDCPCRVGDAVQEAIRRGVEASESMGRQVLEPQVSGDMSAEVFCNRSLLEDIIEHLLGNAIDPRHASSVAENKAISIRIEVALDEEEARILVLNDKTKLSEPTGMGMAYFDRYVRNYGGRLSGSQLGGESPWTYRADLLLQRYRPVYPIAGTRTK